MTTTELRRAVKAIDPEARVSKVDEGHWIIRTRYEKTAIVRALGALGLSHDPDYEDLEGSHHDWIYVIHVFAADEAAHATKKKSASQLQREIDNVLSQPRALTTERFNELASHSTETVQDFEALLTAARKLQPKTIIGVRGDYGGVSKVAEGRFIRLAETSPISAPWSRRAIVEETFPVRPGAELRQIDVSVVELRALPKTRFKRR